MWLRVYSTRCWLANSQAKDLRLLRNSSWTSHNHPPMKYNPIQKDKRDLPYWISRAKEVGKLAIRSSLAHLRSEHLNQILLLHDQIDPKSTFRIEDRAKVCGGGHIDKGTKYCNYNGNIPSTSSPKRGKRVFVDNL